jgi:8-oxo-dGTP diphosphatase
MSSSGSDVSAPAERPLPVAIAIIRRGDRFLVRQRPAGTVYAGYWEFPGGKCEPGESPAAAAERESLEETGLCVSAGRLRRQITHRYPHGLVQLHFFDCTITDDAAEPASELGCRWVTAVELPALRFPEANEAVIAELVQEAR